MSSTKQRLDEDLKVAMLAGEKDKVTLLRGLKSAVLYAEVAEGARDAGLSEDGVVKVLAKEAKKRREGAEAYKQAGDEGRSNAELEEEKLINKYLPEQIGEDELRAIVDEIITLQGAEGMQSMGQVIGGVKQKVGPGADGSVVASIVKEQLAKL